jgi:acetylornithine deacetylase/succinyl-diaminopimelate desuccinylase-like protein
MTPTPPAAAARLARQILSELIATDTTPRSGTTAAAEAIAGRLRRAGFPSADVQVLGPHPSRCNLVARLRGSGTCEPLLLLAHLDTIAADASEWTVDPFTLTESDGFFYGRGVLDNKALAALWLATLIRLRGEGHVPDRDLVVALTADEEGGEHNGAEWLLRQHRELVQAGFGLNEGGYGRIRQGERTAHQVQASEKVPVDLMLEASGPAGHSSLPLRNTAVSRLARALVRLAEHRFPWRLTEATRAFFARMATIEPGQAGADMAALLAEAPEPAAIERLTANPYFEGLLRTTCVATRLEAGEASNVIPSRARAVLNCRLLPGDSPAELRAALATVIADSAVEVRTLREAAGAPASPLLAELFEPLEALSEEFWPGVPVVPVMTIGATDNAHFRRAGIPMYGVTGLFLDMDDVRAHAPDERIEVRAFFEAQEFLYRLVRRLAEGTPGGAHSTASSRGGSEA